MTASPSLNRPIARWRTLARRLVMAGLPMALVLLAATPAKATLDDLLGGSASDEPELLAPEIAYVPVVTRATPDSIEVLWQIAPDYYLYRDKTKATLSDAGDARLGEPEVDEGTIQHDEFFGDVAVWREEARMVLPLATPAEPGSNATLTIAWQGCADIGVCFPPKETTLTVAFAETTGAVGLSEGGLPALTGLSSSSAGAQSDVAAVAQAVQTAPTEQATSAAAAPLQSEHGRLAALLGSRGLWLNAAMFFGLGLLLAFTPCVLPMIPILSSLIVGKGDAMTPRRAFGYSLVYVLVMATTYAVLGVIVGLSGYNIQPLLQDPLVLGGIAVLFVLLSLSMFGLYELQVPRGVQAKLTNWSNSQRGGDLGGVALMALISTLIVGPCVTAPLAGALIYIADTGNAAIGGVALFSLGLGMGAPLLLIGTSAGTLLPRAGAWMDRTKQFFGILLLAMAIYMLSRFLPASITMALAGALAIGTAVLVGATDTLGKDSTGGHRFAKSVGLVVGVYGLALMVGALSGGGSYFRPLETLAVRDGGNGAVGAVGNNGATANAAVSGADRLLPETHNGELVFQPVKGPDGLLAAVQQASADGRPVMLDFYADWCISCKEMEAFTFTDPAVQAALGNTLVVQADVTANDAEDQALLKQFGLFGPPGIIFYDALGNEVPGAQVVGFVPAVRFAEHVGKVIGGQSS